MRLRGTIGGKRAVVRCRLIIFIQFIVRFSSSIHCQSLQISLFDIFFYLLFKFFSLAEMGSFFFNSLFLLLTLTSFIFVFHLFCFLLFLFLIMSSASPFSNCNLSRNIGSCKGIFAINTFNARLIYPPTRKYFLNKYSRCKQSR